ncbi:HAMP domain-containing sensor histidine kinase [Deltaproteobacteria bacterium TL4]
MAEEHTEIKTRISYLIHDIEPSLASFQSVLRLLKTNQYDPKNPLHQRLIASCDSAMAFSKDLLQNMLEYSRLHKIGISLIPDWIEWEKVLEEMLSLSLALSQEKEILIVWEVEEGGLKSFSDSRLMRRILNNLVINAIQNAPSHSTIGLRFSRKGDSVQVLIQDEGPGLPAEQMESIFQEHVQWKLRKTKQYKGVGLGLSFCKESCVLLGASLSVQNRKPHGLEFTLILPNQ